MLRSGEIALTGRARIPMEPIGRVLDVRLRHSHWRALKPPPAPVFRVTRKMVCTLQKRTRRLEGWLNGRALAEHVETLGSLPSTTDTKQKSDQEGEGRASSRVRGYRPGFRPGSRRSAPKGIRVRWVPGGSVTQHRTQLHSCPTQPRSHKKVPHHVPAPRFTTDNRNRRNLRGEKGQPWFRTKGFWTKPRTGWITTLSAFLLLCKFKPPVCSGAMSSFVSIYPKEPRFLKASH